MGSKNNAISETQSKLTFIDRLLAVYESCLFMAETYDENQWLSLADQCVGVTVKEKHDAIASLRRVQSFDMLVSLSFVFFCMFIFY
jgi:SUMO ligase MMS21 Smc5/6 complex component